MRGAAAPKALSTATYYNIDKRRKKLQISTLSYVERRKKEVTYPIFLKSMKEVSLQRHVISQHKCTLVPKHEQRQEELRGTFATDNHAKGSFNECSVPNFTGGGKDTHSMHLHFACKHPKANVIISGDRNADKYNECGMKTGTLDKYQRSETCRKLMKRRENEEKQDLQVEAEKVAFTLNGIPVERTPHFKCLGC